ncbi:MAG: enoyl-CoA hydratase/isomerase family protein [Pseudolabrys sp.]|nr:enoyl-CoA hydratase/isomerase family protein [Pseudolabrys sp.]
MSMSDLTVSKRRDGVTILTLHRPDKRNALNAPLVSQLHDAFDEAVADQVRLLVFVGEGKSFCSGFDLSTLGHESEGDLLLRFVRIETLLFKVFSAPFVTLAIGKGVTLGAGADLFAACDRRVALDDLRIGFPGAGFGLILGTARLIARVGSDAARALVRSGDIIDAETALRIGLVTDRIDADATDQRIEAERVAASRLDRETVRALHRVALSDGSQELAALVRSAARPGLKDRIRAYMAASQGGKARQV